VRMLTAVLALSLLAPAAAAVASPHDDAVTALRGGASAEARRRAVQELAESGVMADAPDLVRALRDTDTLVRALAENALWRVWSRSGDPDVDRLFALGVEQMSQRQMDAAVETFTRIIERRPDFAEGWNKRATVYFMRGDLDLSLVDCDEVLKRNPYHFGVLSGYGMIYLQRDEPTRALSYFERALAVNPNLKSVEETVEALRRLLLQQRKNTI